MPNTKLVPLFIGGQERPSSTNATFEVRNPANGELLSNAAAATADDWYAFLFLQSPILSF